MPLLKTTKNEDGGTSKETLRISDNWVPAIHFSEKDETELNFVIETIDERFCLDIYVTDRQAVLEAFRQLFNTLQEYQIGE